MSRLRGSTPVKFVTTYLVVFALMLGWWLALQASTDVGPVLTVLVAYAAPVAAWVAVPHLVGEKQRLT